METKSHAVTLSLRCPACGTDGTFATWDYIDAADGALRRRVLTDEGLFFYTCPHCDAAVQVESQCLYGDRDQKLLIWHIPEPKLEVSAAAVQAFTGEASLDDYRCRAVLTWGEWREKLIEMESGYDDRLYELIKYGAYRLIKEADRQKLPLAAYHLDYADGAGRSDSLALVFMEEGKAGSGYVYPITARLLDVTQDVFLPLIERVPALSGKGVFERYGYTWAQQFMTQLLQSVPEDGNGAYGQLIGFWIQTLGKEIFNNEIMKET